MGAGVRARCSARAHVTPTPTAAADAERAALSKIPVALPSPEPAREGQHKTQADGGPAQARSNAQRQKGQREPGGREARDRCSGLQRPFSVRYDRTSDCPDRAVHSERFARGDFPTGTRTLRPVARRRRAAAPTRQTDSNQAFVSVVDASGGLGQGRDLGRRQPDRRGGEVVVQVCHGAGAGDRQDRRRAGQ
jgi:hypothetical protein